MASDLFRIRDHVADFDAIVADILDRSRRTYDSVRMNADIPYGPGKSEHVDLFFPAAGGSGLPVHIFIHGGYWRMFSKRDYACVADTITAAGAIAVIVDYDLMPGVRMATIVDQVRRAALWVKQHIAEYGGDPDRLTVSGHSAGAHLATFLFDAGRAPSGIAAALLLGGLYDLEPLRSSFLQPEIGLTDAEVEAFTPMTHSYDPAVRVFTLVGADETPPFHAQAATFSERLRRQGLDVSEHEIAGRNHMDSVRDLAIAGSEAGRLLSDCIGCS